MLNVTPVRSLELDHRAYYLRSAARQPLAAAASGEGRITLFQTAADASSCLRCGWESIKALSLHPSEPLVAVVGGPIGALRILHFDGSVVFEVPPPSIARASWEEPGFHDSGFTVEGEFLWCSAPLSRDSIEIQLRDTRTWSVLAKTMIADPFGKSAALFFPSDKPELTALWLAAGQDGQQVYWLRNGRDWCQCSIEPALRDTAPPAFPSSGSEFLVVGADGALRKHAYPSGAILGACKSPDSENDPFSEGLTYLSSVRALAQTNERRLFLIDIASMRILDEVGIDGHEPRPAEYYNPTLRGERQLCTDIGEFVRIGDTLVFASRLDRGTGARERRDQLMFVPVDALLA
jgi:hypothetical protein